MRAATPLSHGQPLRHLLTAAFEVLETRHPRGMSLGVHEHERACLNFVLEGCYREDLASGAGAYGPQACVFKPAGEAHSNRFEHAGARCLLIQIQQPEPALEMDLGRPSSTRDPAAATLALHLWHELAVADELSGLSVDEWALQLCERALGARPRGGIRSERLGATLELLHDGWNEPWSLATLARRVGLHPSHLARAFHEKQGSTIGEYLRRLRVNEVARRLALSDEPIAALASAAGFADQSHCTRAFRRLLGTTPAAYRRAFRG